MIDRADELAARLKRKAGTEDNKDAGMFDEVLKAQRHSIEADRRKVEESIELHERVKVVFEAYDYNFEQMQAAVDPMAYPGATYVQMRFVNPGATY